MLTRGRSAANNVAQPVVAGRAGRGGRGGRGNGRGGRGGRGVANQFADVDVSRSDTSGTDTNSLSQSAAVPGEMPGNMRLGNIEVPAPPGVVIPTNVANPGANVRADRTAGGARDRAARDKQTLALAQMMQDALRTATASGDPVVAQTAIRFVAVMHNPSLLGNFGSVGPKPLRFGGSKCDAIRSAAALKEHLAQLERMCNVPEKYLDLVKDYATPDAKVELTRAVRDLSSDDKSVPAIVQTAVVQYFFPRVRMEADVARDKLYSGKVCMRGDDQLKLYVKRFKQVLADIPEMHEEDVIRFFIAGLSQPLKVRCLTDYDGNAWKSLNKLIDYAYGQEMALFASRTFTKPYNRNGGSGSGSHRLHFVRKQDYKPRGRPNDRPSGRYNGHNNNKRTRPEGGAAGAGSERAGTGTRPIGPDGEVMTYEQYKEARANHMCWNCGANGHDVPNCSSPTGPYKDGRAVYTGKLKKRGA